VIRRTADLLEAMGAGEPDFRVGLLAAAFHDTVQHWVPNPGANGAVMRKRFAGRNEAESAAEAVAWMRGSGAGFTDADCGVVERAILATVPGWDPDNQTVSQPNLPADAPPVVRAVALADLGIAGMDGTPYIQTGDELFREDNIDIGRAVRPGASDPPPDVWDGYKQRMLAWSRFQSAFARGRRARLEIELGDLRGPARDAVRKLFTRFDEAIALAESTVKAREHLAPPDVARAMGYTPPDC
jgi:hypothetical protein